MKNAKSSYLNYILGGAVIVTVLYLLYSKYGKNSQNGDVNRKSADTLTPTLKEFYSDLKTKGYNPITAPVNDTSTFVSFKITNGDDKLTVIANEKNGIIIYSDPTKPPFTVDFAEGKFVINSGVEKGFVVAESSKLIDGVLQMVENRDYK